MRLTLVQSVCNAAVLWMYRSCRSVFCELVSLLHIQKIGMVYLSGLMLFQAGLLLGGEQKNFTVQVYMAAAIQASEGNLAAAAVSTNSSETSDPGTSQPYSQTSSRSLFVHHWLPRLCNPRIIAAPAGLPNTQFGQTDEDDGSAAEHKVKKDAVSQDHADFESDGEERCPTCSRCFTDCWMRSIRKGTTCCTYSWSRMKSFLGGIFSRGKLARSESEPTIASRANDDTIIPGTMIELGLTSTATPLQLPCSSPLPGKLRSSCSAPSLLKVGASADSSSSSAAYPVSRSPVYDSFGVRVGGHIQPSGKHNDEHSSATPSQASFQDPAFSGFLDEEYDLAQSLIFEEVVDQSHRSIRMLPRIVSPRCQESSTNNPVNNPVDTSSLQGEGVIANVDQSHDSEERSPNDPSSPQGEYCIVEVGSQSHDTTVVVTPQSQESQKDELQKIAKAPAPLAVSWLWSWVPSFGRSTASASSTRS